MGFSNLGKAVGKVKRVFQISENPYGRSNGFSKSRKKCWEGQMGFSNREKPVGNSQRLFQISEKIHFPAQWIGKEKLATFPSDLSVSPIPRFSAL
jgi:hypothetical protein